MTRDELLTLHGQLCLEAQQIMAAKNHDYTGASGDPFANFRASEIFGVESTISILVRVLDKLQRIKTFAEKGELRVENESVKDAILDVMNYMVLIAGMIWERRSLPDNLDDFSD